MKLLNSISFPLLGFLIGTFSTISQGKDLEQVPGQSRQFPGGGFFPPAPAAPALTEDDYEDEATSPGPGALGVLTGLFGVFNGIGSLISSGSPNKILESSINFLPPHQREQAQQQLNNLIGKTTKKPPEAQVIYVTVTVPPTPATPAPVKDVAVAALNEPTQTPNITVVAQFGSNVTSTTKKSTTEDPDEEEEDYSAK